MNSPLGDYLRHIRMVRGFPTLKSLSDRIKEQGNSLSIEMIRQYEMTVRYPTGNSIKALTSALMLSPKERNHLLALIGMDKLKKAYPDTPVIILNENYLSAISEAVGSTVRRRLERVGVSDTESISIQLEVTAECRAILTMLSGEMTPHTPDPFSGSPST